MSSYRALLARPHARRLAAASGAGWWAYNGYGLALVLAIEHATGSFAAAGAATAAFAVGSALLAPVRGRAVDRGGAPVLLWLAAAHCAALVVVLVATTQHDPALWILAAASGVGGATAPPLTATGRKVWTQIAGAELTRAAHAVNAVLGETAAIVSPVAVTVLAAVASPLVALAVLLPGTGVAALGIAGLLNRPPPPSESDAAATTRAPALAASGKHTSRPRARSILRDSPGLRWLMAGDIASGIWLGGLEVAAPALSAEAGVPLLAGAPLLGLAIGGISASLWTGSARGNASAAQRYVWGAVGAAAILPLALLAPGSGTLTVVAICAGLAYGLINVALFELVDHVADAGRSVEAFTWITTGQATGLAVGAAVAGALADAAAPHALYVVAGGPLLGAAAALAGRRSLRTRANVANRERVAAQVHPSE